MRPQQQNRRMRGRNNNNRKGPNPLTRNYESNGPDVKIRGSAQQVADKYTTLARDAQSAGDRVMAENYLQHAEHYNRIIAAATAQQQVQREERAEQEQRENQSAENRGSDNANERAAAERNPNIAENQPPAGKGTGPQPVIGEMPAEVAIDAQAPAEKPSRRRAAAADHKDSVVSVADGEAEPPKRTRRPRRPVEAKTDSGAEKPDTESGKSEPAGKNESLAPVAD